MMGNGIETGFIKKLGINGVSELEPFSYKLLDNAKEGITKPQYIQFGNITAFKKDSRFTDESDDMELVINWIGRKLGISMAETYRFLSINQEPTALISVNVATTSNKTFFSMEKVREQIIAAVKEGTLPYESWMKRYTDLLEQKAYPSVEEAFESSVNSENEAREIIEVGERFIDIISTAQTNRILLKRKYRQMIFLDALVGQVDRTLGNYGLIYDEIEHQYSFAPLFDNATLRKPYTGFGICLVNGFVAERKYVLKILLEDKKILSMAKLLIENKFQIIPSLLKIAAEWLEPKQYDLLISNFFFGLFVLEALIIKK